MKALDPVLGQVRRCPTCGEWWPDDAEFYYQNRCGWQCRACWSDRNARRHARRLDGYGRLHDAAHRAASGREGRRPQAPARA